MCPSESRRVGRVVGGEAGVRGISPGAEAESWMRLSEMVSSLVSRIVSLEISSSAAERAATTAVDVTAAGVVVTGEEE
jgi:hypothetical protein